MNILITGASDGIGGACARRFAAGLGSHARGARFVLTTSGRKPAPQPLIDALEAQGIEVLHLTGDLGKEADCLEIAARTREFCPRLDVFVSNAGGVSPAPLKDVTTSEWDRLFDLDARATFLLARELRPALAAAGGAIVAVSTTSAIMPHPGHGAYSPAKAALNMLVRGLAQEWATERIRVNAVAPGLINTPLTASVYARPEVRAAREAIVPLGRIGTPEDVAAAVHFLAGREAGFITGQILAVDGGMVDASLTRVPGLPPARAE